MCKVFIQHKQADWYKSLILWMFIAINKPAHLQTTYDRISSSTGADPEKILCRYIITVDETYLPLQSLQSWDQTLEYTSNHQSKSAIQPHTSRIMVPVIWNSESVLVIQCMGQGKTITGICYAELIQKLWFCYHERLGNLVLTTATSVASSWQCTSKHLHCHLMWPLFMAATLNCRATSHVIFTNCS